MNFFDVIWLYDRATRPQKEKMQVCIDYDEGWFLRINTRNVIRPCVPISKALNGFLDHDSHIDCSLHIIDEYEIEEVLRTDGVYGTVNLCHTRAVLDALTGSIHINERDKEQLRVLFAPHL